MEKYLFMKPVLQLISQGGFFRKVSSIFLKIIATAVLLSGLVMFFKLWKVIFELPASAMIGGFIFQLFFIVAVYMVLHTLLIRAFDIDVLPDSEFTVIPIISISLKLIGEIYASFLSVIAVGGGILLWFAGYRGGLILEGITGSLPWISNIQVFDQENFLGGLMFILSGLIMAFFFLIFFYLLSELTIILVNIAKSTKKVSDVFEKSTINKVDANEET